MLAHNNQIGMQEEMQRKKVVVVGVNGAIAREVIPRLIKNYDVAVIARSPPEFAINSIYLRFIEGDALDGEIWDQCLPGTHAVVSCFGVREGEDEQTHKQFIELLVQKMQQKGVKRFIGFFSHGAVKNQAGKRAFESEGFANKARGQCHSECIDVLNKSELNYTAICLYKFQTGEHSLSVSEQTWDCQPADSTGLSAVLLSELQSPAHVRRTIFVKNKA